MDELLTTLIQVVIIPAIPILAAFIARYLKVSADQASAKIENDLIRFYLEEATEVVLQAVTYTAQTYVDSLKAQGAFDKEAQREAFHTAKNVAAKLITTEARESLEVVYGDVDTWLEAKIEQLVKEGKEERK